ncbi:MAG: helix-turn-helix transcriptional regulator [Bacteroidia bacterium]|nr:helix-turn-helix transcriptional regulator [Bacteroidia bacterium]
MDVNKKILEYLKKERISQSELADKTGITQQNLNRLLNAENIKVSQMLEITKALELPSTYFIDGKVQAKNDEIEWRNKRIEELEEMLRDKNLIINERRRYEDQRLFDAVLSLLDLEFKNVKANTKKEILEQFRKSIGDLAWIVETPINFITDEKMRNIIVKEIQERIIKIENKKSK